MPRLRSAENIAAVLDHLGLKKAHFAVRLDTDWTRFVVTRPEAIASLTLVCPSVGFDVEAVRPLGARVQVITDDQGTGQNDRDNAASLADASMAMLPNYSAQLWSDVVADRPDEVEAAVVNFAAGFALEPVSLPSGDGEVGGVSYHVAGAGPPLVLLPLVLAPSQWEPLLPRLRRRFTTITLGAADIGFVPVLESRGQTGYINTVNSVVDEMHIKSGDRLLDVGCGSGVLSRWLAERTACSCPITALDQNPYLLREAAALADSEGLGDVITFREGDAADLPFYDGSFDATMSFTVLEQVDADKALAELVRVTKTGRQVGVVVGAVDRPWQVNLNLSDTVRAKVEAPAGGVGVGVGSCADISLYERVRLAGLRDLKIFPYMAALTGPMGYYYLDRLEGKLTPDERTEWRAAVTQAEANGTLFIAQPFHCAVGTKSF